jgi:IclR family transcriptional regulator, KDG regulon repressor
MNGHARKNGSAAVKSADRSLDMLELLAEHRDGLTLSEVCEALGWPKSSTLALLRTLRRRDYLADGRRPRSYRLGAQVGWLGTAYLTGIDLVRDGQEVVHIVSRRCDETVHLATLDGGDVLYVAKEEGTGQVRMVSAVGRRIPAHGTGVGKMLLSGLSTEELARRYPPDAPLAAMTPTTITDRAALLAELAETRARGYAIDNGESTVGLRCLAAPVFDASGRMVAAMSVSVPSPRFSPDRSGRLLEVIREGAAMLSRRLGASVQTEPAADRQATSVDGVTAEVVDGARYR